MDEDTNVRRLAWSAVQLMYLSRCMPAWSQPAHRQKLRRYMPGEVLEDATLFFTRNVTLRWVVLVCLPATNVIAEGFIPYKILVWAVLSAIAVVSFKGYLERK